MSVLACGFNIATEALRKRLERYGVPYEAAGE